MSVVRISIPETDKLLNDLVMRLDAVEKILGEVLERLAEDKESKDGSSKR